MCSMYKEIFKWNKIYNRLEGIDGNPEKIGDKLRCQDGKK